VTTTSGEPTTTPGETSLRPLARTAVAIAGTRVVLLASGVMASVLIARTLGPEGRGQYAVIVAMVVTAVSLGHCSVEHAQVYLVGRGADVRGLTANAVVLGLLLGTVVAGLTAVVALAFSYPDDQSLQHPALPLALPGIPLSIVVLWTNGLLVLEGRTGVLNRAMLFSGAIQIVMLVGLTLSDRLSVTTVVLAWTVNVGASLVLTLPALRPRSAYASVPLAREALGFGLRYHSATIGRFLLLRVDVLILASMKDDRTVGLYALAVTLIELTNLATDAVSTAALRRQTELPLDESSRFTARVVGLSGVFAVLAAVVLVATAPFLVPLVFGEEFRDCLPAVFALAPGVVALAMARSAGNYLVRHNRLLINSVLALGALAINVALNLVLIPRWGITGTGVASSIAYVLLAGSYLLWLRRAAGLSLRDFRPGLFELLQRRWRGGQADNSAFPS